MEIINSLNGFDLVESNGFKIINKYIDLESKLLIVEELNLANDFLFYYTIDNINGCVINHSDRGRFFKYNEYEKKCQNENFKIVIKREQNSYTGKEVIQEKLIDRHNHVLLERQIIAFNKDQINSIEDLYNENLKSKKNEQSFWIEEYPQYSVERKITYWVSNIHHGMRMQGEATADPYSEFSIKWYLDVILKDSDFDVVFEKVVPKLGVNFDWTEYNKRIGKII